VNGDQFFGGYSAFIFMVVHYVEDLQSKVYLTINSSSSNLKEEITVLPQNGGRGNLLNLKKI
jgi:hypothetical protein